MILKKGENFVISRKACIQEIRVRISEEKGTSQKICYRVLEPNCQGRALVSETKINMNFWKDSISLVYLGGRLQINKGSLKKAELKNRQFNKI